MARKLTPAEKLEFFKFLIDPVLAAAEKVQWNEEVVDSFSAQPKNTASGAARSAKEVTVVPPLDEWGW